MKTKIATVLGMVLCLNMALSAMVIHNYCNEKDETISLETGVFNEDYLYLGHELKFSGEAEDLLFFGKRLTLDGTTKLGLIAGCERLDIAGSSGNGIIAGAKDISINGTINSTSFAGCKSFTLREKGVINGSLFIGCAKLLIDGRLTGDLYAGAGEIVINNEINGNVKAYGGRITIGEKGKINGNLTYAAKEKLSAVELARVRGTVTIQDWSKGDTEGEDFKKVMKAVGIFIMLGLFISVIIIGSLLLFLPAFKKLDKPQTAQAFWRTLLWGLIPVFIYPALVVLSIVMVVTIPLAIMLLLAFVPLFFVAFVMGITLTGKYLVMVLKWNVQKRHYQFLIGIVAVLIISIIPFIDCLLFLAVCSLGWGKFISFLFNKDLTV